MAAYRTVKLMIGSGGEVHLAPGTKVAGYPHMGPPIVAIVEVPDDVTDDDVIRTYSRCVLLPVMHAKTPIPWHKISGARQGQIIRLGPGRPTLDPAEKYVRINISLPPESLAILDARGNGRSQEIVRLIRESVKSEGGDSGR